MRVASLRLLLEHTPIKMVISGSQPAMARATVGLMDELVTKKMLNPIPTKLPVPKAIKTSRLDAGNVEEKDGGVSGRGVV